MYNMGEESESEVYCFIRLHCTFQDDSTMGTSVHCSAIAIHILYASDLVVVADSAANTSSGVYDEVNAQQPAIRIADSTIK